MEILSRQNIKKRIFWDIPHKPYLQDHCVDGQAVLPAVEAMMAMAQGVQSQYSQARFCHLSDARFVRFLTVEPKPSPPAAQNSLKLTSNPDAAICPEPDSGSLAAQIEMEEQENGIRASLFTSIQIKNSSIRRNLEHASVTFCQNPELPKPEMAFSAAQKLGNDALKIDATDIYRRFVPFGKSYRNIIGQLSVSPDGALAQISTLTEADDNLLGLPFVADAAMHAACVWGKKYADIIAFPVGFARRFIYKLTRKKEIYLARIAPVKESGHSATSRQTLIFNVWIFDQKKEVCEVIHGLRMQDIGPAQGATGDRRQARGEGQT